MTKLICMIVCACRHRQVRVCVGRACLRRGHCRSPTGEYPSLCSELQAHAYVKYTDEISLILQFTAG